MKKNTHPFALDQNELGRIEKLSRITDIQRRLQVIADHDWSDMPPNSIWEVIKRYIHYFPLQVSVAMPFDIDTIRLYRCRLNIDSQQENLEFWSTFSCPPPAFCKSNGRANVAGFPVFYCSDHPTAAIAEMRPKVGDIVYLSDWFVRCFRETRRTIIFPHDISEVNPWRDVARNKIASEIEGYTGLFGEQVSKNILEMLKFMSKLFSHEREPYPISSAISHKVLFGSKMFSSDYILYPSFQNNGHNSNLAFHPNFVSQNFYLNKVLKLEIQQSNSKGVQVQHVETGRVTYNKIVWGPPHPSELDFTNNNTIP